MGELGGEVAVVGEQEHAGGVAVEASYGIDAFGAGTLDEVHDGGAVLGVFRGGDAVFGFVEEDVALRFQCDYLFIVFNDVRVRNLGAEFGDDLAVYLDKALLDELVGLAARAYAGVAHELVETDLFVGIGNRHFIFDALGTGSEALSAAGEHALALLHASALLIAALTFLIASLTLGTLLVATLLAGLITALLTGLVATFAALIAALALGTLLVATLTALIAALALLTGLVATLLAGSALLIAAGTFLIAALALLTGLVATLLAGLITAFAALVTALAGLIAALIF